MPIVTSDVYKEMFKHAKENKFAYPTINVTPSQALTAALRGLSDAESDGIIQVSVGGAEYWPGSSTKDRIADSLAMVAYAKEIIKGYPVTVALHTGHYTEDELASWTEALINPEVEEVKAGRLSFFQSHMFDGSSIPLDWNLEVAKRLLPKTVAANTVLEVEIGIVGGEEDGVVSKTNGKLYTATADSTKMVEALGLDGKGHYLTALTFGNVCGVYKPGHVRLRPELLSTIQQEVGAHSKTGGHPFDLVARGDSGSTTEKIVTAAVNGVIKMDVDTDAQYAYTRPAADWMYRNYGGVLKVDGEVGVKKQCNPRAWGKAAETGTAAHVAEACQRPGPDGTTVK